LLVPKIYRRPQSIRSIAENGIFGEDLYVALSNAKIVINAAIDMSGKDRGNMRCFEALGAGALLLSDEGTYPEGMLPDKTMVTYSSTSDAINKISELLENDGLRKSVASEGHRMISSLYSKERQWQCLLDLL